MFYKHVQRYFLLYKHIQVNTPRTFSNFVRKEISVPTSCNIHINIPCKVNVTPLDVHKYQNLDRIILYTKGKENISVKHEICNDNITVYTDDIVETNVVLNCEVPINSNIHVKSDNSIKIGSMFCQNLIAKSNKGDISIGKFQGDSVDVQTTTGNVQFFDSVQCSTINAEILQSGNIKTDKLQGLNLSLKTHQGDVEVASTYCNMNLISVRNGNLKLHNAHRKCELNVINGNLDITGFDGELETTVNNGNAMVQLSRILGSSHITIKNGSLQLKLADECQETTEFAIKCSKYKIDNNIQMASQKTDDGVNLEPKTKNIVVNVNCNDIHISAASWEEMLKLRIKK